MDIVGQQRPDRRVVTAGVESLLGLWSRRSNWTASARSMTWLMKAPNVPSWTYSSRRPSPRAHEVA